jgi:hypothetical protein
MYLIFNTCTHPPNETHPPTHFHTHTHTQEWTPLDVHQDLGRAAGAAYVRCRQQGDDDMSSLVLGLSNELLAFNYRDTFVNAFEVRAVCCYHPTACTGADSGIIG